MYGKSQKIYVYENWQSKQPTLIGILYADHSKGKELFSFEYDDKWLNVSHNNILFDPDLNLYKGRQYTPLDKNQFGIFADSCPDRWGRLLMRRRENIIARKEQRKPGNLLESDYLLGAYDEARMGALRFRTSEDGDFLSNDKALATPPWTTLRTLEAASFAFENDESGLEERWLNQLIAPGSSLGGARPKATVQDTDGALWIAKFPSKNDETNSGAWEKTVHDLAKMCGLNVPESKLETFSKNGGTFLVKRFDRDKKQRIHFSSAMSLLGKVDGAEDVSYLDLASFIRSNGCSPKEDLLELWKRIIFNMAVSNTDDHLRNHGFLLSKKGWRLSPLYDVNPIPYGDTLSLNISRSDNTISLDLAVSTAKYYEIETKDAAAMAQQIVKTVHENWQIIATRYGLGRNAIEYMKPAFSLQTIL